MPPSVMKGSPESCGRGRAVVRRRSSHSRARAALVPGVGRRRLGLVVVARCLVPVVLPGQAVDSPRVVLGSPDVVVCSHASKVAADDPVSFRVYSRFTSRRPNGYAGASAEASL